MKIGAKTSGFTLIELSIVLVIIGLIIGGVLVGRDLISAASVRAQISQIEKYNTAVNTFRGKYGYLPGDIPDPVATSYGFDPRGTQPGLGDGNGIIEGRCGNGGACDCGFCLADGETGAVWVDLSAANLIDGGFNSEQPTDTYRPVNVSGPAIGNYFPPARIGRGNYIYVFSGGYSGGWLGVGDGANYFGLSAVTLLTSWTTVSNPGLSVVEANNIDSKIDDGLPQSGRVQANYYNYNIENFHPTWAAGGGVEGAANFTAGGPLPTTAATAGSPTTCYDNGSGSGPQQYSMGQNGGAGLNCALSFRFQ